jgi:hypothetical protein
MHKPSVSSIGSLANTSLEPLLDEYEYARITGRSVASARRDRLLRQGCPFVKLGALVRYRPSDVQAFIERNLRSTNSPSKANA